MQGCSQLGLRREVNFVIHCASAIRFDLSMRDTMAQVYCPTKALLEAAARMPALKAFCYMSSASANPNRPRNSTVEEIIYPLGDPAAPTDGIELAESWLSAPADQANAEVRPFDLRFASGERAKAHTRCPLHPTVLVLGGRTILCSTNLRPVCLGTFFFPSTFVSLSLAPFSTLWMPMHMRVRMWVVCGYV